MTHQKSNNEQIHKKEKKINPYIIIILMLILILVIFAFSSFKIRYTRYVPFIEEVPVKGYGNVTKEIIKKETVCDSFTYDYYREWQGITNFGSLSIPSIYIQNRENRWGEFILNFSFFDESKYDYDLYKGREYADFRDELSREMADMQSENIHTWFGPGEGKIVSAVTKKKNPSATYWALASIIAPVYDDCREVTFPANITESQEIIRYEKVSGQKQVIGYLSIKELLFGWEYFILLVLFIIILVLLYLNYRKYVLDRKRTKKKY